MIKYLLKIFTNKAKSKKDKRFRIINRKINFKNNYLEKKIIIETKIPHKKNQNILNKFYILSKKPSKIVDWGGGTGDNALYLTRKYKGLKVDIYEKKNLINFFSKNVKIKNFFIKYNVRFLSSKYKRNFKRYGLMYSIGSASYIENIYNFLNYKYMPKYIALIRIPLIINSDNEIIVLDKQGNHYEKIYSLKKFRNFFSRKYEIKYIKENWEGLKIEKENIENYKLKSMDIFLKKK